MKKQTRHYSRLIAAALIMALLCVSGCTGSGSITADEDNSFTHFEEYVEYDNEETLNSALELARILGESWYGDGNSETASSEHSWLLDYSVSAHTQDGRGVFALHIPGSAGMSQIDFILLTTKDYGRTWNPSGGVYHVVGGVSQITINRDYIYLVVDMDVHGASRVLVSDDFGSTFRIYGPDQIIPKEHLTRLSELYGVYIRIANAERDGDMVLECYCNGYMEDMGSDNIQEYNNSFKSDDERVIMILRSDEDFSEVKMLYADDSLFD